MTIGILWCNSLYYSYKCTSVVTSHIHMGEKRYCVSVETGNESEKLLFTQIIYLTYIWIRNESKNVSKQLLNK